jgi:hypothetical protein
MTRIVIVVLIYNTFVSTLLYNTILSFGVEMIYMKIPFVYETYSDGEKFPAKLH